MLRAGAPDVLIVVGSLAVAVLVAPPPEAAAELVRLAGALAATLTVSVMAGKLAPAASTVVDVQVKVPKVQAQPVPLMVVAVRPVGRVSTTVTVPLVEAVPELVTVIV
jgi:hypothetical protein